MRESHDVSMHASCHLSFLWQVTSEFEVSDEGAGHRKTLSAF